MVQGLGLQLDGLRFRVSIQMVWGLGVILDNASGLELFLSEVCALFGVRAWVLSVYRVYRSPSPIKCKADSTHKDSQIGRIVLCDSD